MSQRAGNGPQMSTVEIEYCVPCGLLPAAVEVSRTVLERFGANLGELRLVPGEGGVFRVRVDDGVVFDKADEGYDLDSIVDRVSRRMVPQPVHFGPEAG